MTLFITELFAGKAHRHILVMITYQNLLAISLKSYDYIPPPHSY